MFDSFITKTNYRLASSPGFRHIERGILPRYAELIEVKTFPTGERRIKKDPPREAVEKAFAELGTSKAVATAFGVGRDVVKRWTSEYEMDVISRPEAGLANTMKLRLREEVDRCKAAQWLMDEGSVSVAYFRRGDYTILLVCGSMNDYLVLASISDIIDARITSSRVPKETALPMSAIRVQSARAYALLEAIAPHLLGLKAMEAQAALRRFPPSGILRGRHTTEEFFLPIWKQFPLEALILWNARRRVKMSQLEIFALAEKWVEGRVKRARRFIDAPVKSEIKDGKRHL